ncbi:MAG: putative baseplate assembly protein, partial [Myxococcota bacterium]
VRRHARALDYRMHEGAAARAWVQLVAAEGIALDSRVLSPGAWFSTAVDGVAIHADAVDVEEAIRNGAEVFESLTPLDHLVDAHGEITVHAWGMDQAELPAGATEAILVDPGGEDARRLRLRRGDVVVFETTRGGASWRLEDADPTLRIAVRLVADPEPLTDPLLGEALLRIRWGTRDALPRAIPTRAWGLATAVARADIVLVSHGAPRVETGLRPELWGTGEWESGEGTVLLHLRGGDVAWRAPLQVPRPGPTSTSALGLPPGSPEWSARDLLEAEPRLATAAIRLFEDGSSDDWVSVPDLLDTDEGDLAVFVAEREEDGAVTLRFGDGVQGRRPPESAVFRAEYRQGGGPRGNLGAGALRHVYSDELASGLIAAVRQPLPAFGGAEPEDLRAVKILAPKAYRSQLRAVTLEDWAEVAGRHPEVQRAVARMHWTGTRHLVTVHVDRVGMRPVDEDFERELKAWLEPYRLTGYLLRVTGPVWVNLEVVLTVVCAPTAYRSEVGRALAQLFGAQVLPDGELGWFHPDRFTFGQEVYLSPIVARAMNVPGVEQVEASPADPRHRFRRSTEATDHLDTGRLELDELEVARCESDPSAPERGYISFILEGGA